MRHPPRVTLKTIRHFASLWLRRPLGRLAGSLLLVALIMGGMPTGQVHAHDDGDHDHEHVTQLAADAPLDQDDPSDPSEPDEGFALHAHDVCLTFSAMLAPPQLALSTPVSVTPKVRLAAPPSPSSAQSPPHRPPIA